MKIANEFTISVPVDDAWDVLTDLAQVVPLMPGAQLIGQEGDDYLGKVKVKVGPVTSEFTGKAHFVELDREHHRAVIDARGREARGTGNAAAVVTAHLRPEGNLSHVTVDTDLKIVGKLAQFGGGMLQQVSEKLLGQFVESLEAKLGGSAVEAAPQQAVAEEPAATAPKQAHTAESATAAAEPAPIDLLELAGGTALKKYGPVVVARASAAAGVRVGPGVTSTRMTAPLLLPGVDLAAFAVALVAQVRAAGVAVAASGPAGFVQALRQLTPRSRSELYWAARLTLVNRVEDLTAFDAAFDAVFGHAGVGLDPPARRLQRGAAVASAPGVRTGDGPALDAGGLPWVTRPSVSRHDGPSRQRGGDTRRAAKPDRRPRRRAVRAIRCRGPRACWAHGWNRRRDAGRSAAACAAKPSRHGNRIDLRETMKASRTTGWEPLRARTYPAAAPSSPRRAGL